MTGIVYKSTGSWYSVKDATGKFWNTRIKGVLKLDDITSTNPVAVGDVVDFNIEADEQAGIITKIHDRKNHINRQSPRHKHQQHIVASNVDQSLLLATIREPRTSQGFIDRFLVATEMYHVPAIILFNKMDVYKEKDQQQFAALKEMYEKVGYPVLGISIKLKQGVDEVEALLKGKSACQMT
jgi:ribosome biogenesis GTPase